MTDKEPTDADFELIDPGSNPRPGDPFTWAEFHSWNILAKSVFVIGFGGTIAIFFWAAHALHQFLKRVTGLG